jgi:16S rRNA (cytidine1402-2'-O)-methyltransferase
MVKDGKTIAIVSDAGTPNISDPGAVAIADIRQADITVIPIPGASAPATLISASSIDCTEHMFVGFLPKKDNDILALLNKAKTLDIPLICFDSPKRLEKTLALLEKEPIEKMTIGKELTKQYETIVEGTLTEIQTKLATILIKGEWCLIIKFKKEIKENEHAITKKVEALIASGYSPKDIKKICAALDFDKNKWYKIALSLGV